MSEAAGARERAEAMRAREARGALSRAGADGGLFAADRPRGGVDPDADAIEIWGRRIGRGLGLAAAVALVVSLFGGIGR